ncbi:MAG: hypothetical protein AAF394_09570, partial [Planctomycetota bacterium]
MNRLHVDFRLAAARHAVQQNGILFARIEGFQNLLQSLPLIHTQSKWRQAWYFRVLGLFVEASFLPSLNEAVFPSARELPSPHC